MRIRNWESFQHYKDRNPPWIKLHRSLLDDAEFFALSIDSRAYLPMLWLLAAQDDGHIPDNPIETAWRLRVEESTMQAAYQELYDAQFIVEDGERREKARWPSRYIPVAIKAQVLERDKRACTACGSTDNLEVDHIKPVSKGGMSALENLQVLCRGCNRAKRTREWIATKDGIKRSKSLRTKAEQRSLETETYKQEKEGEKEKQATSAFVLPDWVPKPQWFAFIEMRRKQRKPPTSHAMDLIVRELEKLRGSGQDPGEILDQSTRKGWLDVFPLRENGNGKRDSWEVAAERLGQESREAD